MLHLSSGAWRFFRETMAALNAEMSAVFKLVIIGLTAVGMAIVPLDRRPLALPRAAAHQSKDVGAHMSISTSIIEGNFPERRQSPG